jgi:hypothetical protein
MGVKKNQIYKKVDGMMHAFVVSNKDLIDKMGCDQLHSIRDGSMTSRWGYSDILIQEPFGIDWIAKTQGMEGDIIHFFDEDINKLYEYYNVE